VTVKVPSNIDMADTIVWGLTLRQLIVLGGACLLGWSCYLVLRFVIPVYVLAALGTLFAGAGIALAFAQPDGLNAERWAAAGLAFGTKPRRRVLAPEGLPAPMQGRRRSGRVAGFHLPIHGINEAGVIGLGGGRWVLVCRTTAVNLELRSTPERDSLLRGFGRFLNALDRPISVVVRSERSDLRSQVTRIEEMAGCLSHPDLERAARAHASFLSSLAERNDILRREVYVVLSADGIDERQATAQLQRRAEESATLLRSLGIGMTPLEDDDAAALIARASDPGRSLPLRGHNLPSEVVSEAPT
jgi:PrgI family protein